MKCRYLHLYSLYTHTYVNNMHTSMLDQATGAIQLTHFFHISLLHPNTPTSKLYQHKHTIIASLLLISTLLSNFRMYVYSYLYISTNIVIYKCVYIYIYSSSYICFGAFHRKGISKEVYFRLPCIHCVYVTILRNYYKLAHLINTILCLLFFLNIFCPIIFSYENFILL